jgi:lysophospholipase L1-like esterase
VNLGYAGARTRRALPRRETAALRADVISVSHGHQLLDAHAARPGAVPRRPRRILAIVRQRHPALPIVAVSPVLRVDAETTCNRLGATLADLRAAFEDVVRERMRGGDARLSLVPGLPLLPAERFADGIHPDDEGHARLAAALGPLIRAACDDAAREDDR